MYALIITLVLLNGSPHDVAVNGFKDLLQCEAEAGNLRVSGINGDLLQCVELGESHE